MIPDKSKQSQLFDDKMDFYYGQDRKNRDDIANSPHHAMNAMVDV